MSGASARARDRIAFANALGDVNPNHFSRVRHLDRLVVDLQSVQSLIEVRRVPAKVHGVPGAENPRSHRNHRGIHPRVVVGHHANRLRCGL